MLGDNINTFLNLGLQDKKKTLKQIDMMLLNKGHVELDKKIPDIDSGYRSIYCSGYQVDVFWIERYYN